MRKTVLIAALCTCLSLLSGCDFFRSMAGRPTSADIAAKREALENEAARRDQPRLDSLAAVAAAQKEAEDSIAVMSAIAGTTKLSFATRKFDAATTASLDHRYYVIVGAFAEPANARNLAARIDASGFKAVLLKYAGGHTAVGVDPTDKVAKAYDSLQRLSALGFIPKDSWILDVSSL